MTKAAKTYRITDGHTKQVLPYEYKSRKTAHNAAERKNLQYGAHRYYVAFGQ